MRDTRIRENDTHGYPRIIRVVLLENMPSSSQAPAKRLKFDPTDTIVPWKETDEEVQVFDSLDAMGGAKDDKLWVMYRHDSKIHEVLSNGNGGLRLFKLDEGEELGTSAGDSAVCHRWIGTPGSEEEYRPGEDGEVTVYSGQLMQGASAPITEGTFIVAGLINGYWQLVAAPCVS